MPPIKRSECKIRVIKHVPVFRRFCPTIGGIYDAIVCDGGKRSDNRRYLTPFCLIDVSGNTVVLRHGEYEILNEARKEFKNENESDA